MIFLIKRFIYEYQHGNILLLSECRDTQVQITISAPCYMKVVRIYIYKSPII
jgi:hypothetical protein